MAAEPVFGFIFPGGATFGALVRDVRLANELADRGYAVHAWWAFDRPRRSPLRPAVSEHWLFHGARYALRLAPGVQDRLGQGVARLFRDEKRDHFAQKRPAVIERVVQGALRRVCAGVESEPRLVARFARQLTAAQVTHLLPTLEFLCPWALAARPLVPQRMGYTVTFQGYELYANYARGIGLEGPLYALLAHLVRQADWPSIAVSPEYLERIVDDIGVPPEQLRAIPPGIEPPQQMSLEAARRIVARQFPSYRPEVPLVTYLGRRDVEKGIDLLLYAAQILRHQGVPLQLAVCGATTFGQQYAWVCQRIAENLRAPVLFGKSVSNELRSALFTASRCVVYPSIHGEPFGMVPAEAMAHGTPAIVPDHGGVRGAVSAEGSRGGLVFRAWDSGDLAQQIRRLLTDDELWRSLARAAPRVADYYSVANLADRMLAHLEIRQPRRANAA